MSVFACAGIRVCAYVTPVHVRVRMHVRMRGHVHRRVRMHVRVRVHVRVGIRGCIQRLFNTSALERSRVLRMRVCGNVNVCEYARAYAEEKRIRVRMRISYTSPACMQSCTRTHVQVPECTYACIDEWICA